MHCKPGVEDTVVETKKKKLEFWAYDTVNLKPTDQLSSGVAIQIRS